jgi:hypothetical protein
VQDKRDLVFLIFNEELAAVTDEALTASQQHDTLIDQLIDIYRPHYHYFSKDPPLSRILLQELTFYSEGKQAATFHEIRERLISGIEKVIRTAQYEQRIRTKEDPAIVARHVFFVCSGAIRWWIARLTPSPRDGLAELRRLLELDINGLQPDPPMGGRRRRSSVPLRLETASRGDGNFARKPRPTRLS